MVHAEDTDVDPGAMRNEVLLPVGAADGAALGGSALAGGGVGGACEGRRQQPGWRDCEIDGCRGMIALA